ncbi:cyclophilin-like domain-containing protein [Mycena galopus ATCC 62051]|nr:cyclophilin-like domain-containing protein [Mycena galopus ATCC 62051]
MAARWFRVSVFCGGPNLMSFLIEIFCEAVPKTAELSNFLALCASNYYDDSVFHWNIKGFKLAIQVGQGKAFFITYAKQPHLDGKYTIFGKVIDGADSTLDAMERVPVTAKNRPINEFKLTHVRN